mmetsp:Transcript_13507/g.20537  ORF Transcript_13507/g.20537 Transcript_13507/m.20537 type:complete len:202 (+) Transcript_13507:416-1021(+)
MDCVSAWVYSCWVWASSGWMKMAWLALVRLAPEADSSCRKSRSTLGSFLSMVSFCITSSAAVFLCTLPLSCRVLMPAASRAAATCCIRSGNCTKTSTRSSWGRPSMHSTTRASFVPNSPAPLWSRSVPSAPARTTALTRAGARQPGAGHSCRSARSSRQPWQPACPQQLSSPSSPRGTAPRPHAGQPSRRSRCCRSRTIWK